VAHCRVPDISLSERLGYDTGETAALIGVSVSHVYVLIERGDLQSVKIAGRRIIPRWAIEALLGCPIGVGLANKPPRADEGLSAAPTAEALIGIAGTSTAPRRCRGPQRKARAESVVRDPLRASAAPPSLGASVGAHDDHRR
jgi:excisionase family DNA binding protein